MVSRNHLGHPLTDFAAKGGGSKTHKKKKVQLFASCHYFVNTYKKHTACVFVLLISFLVFFWCGLTGGSAARIALAPTASSSSSHLQFESHYKLTRRTHTHTHTHTHTPYTAVLGHRGVQEPHGRRPKGDAVRSSSLTSSPSLLPAALPSSPSL